MPGAVERRGPRPLDNRDLSTRLLDYIQREHPKHFRTVLMDLYDGPLPLRHEQIAGPMAVFEIPLPSGRTAAEEMPSRGLTPKLLGELADRSAGWLSIWEVLEVDPGRTFDAVDLLTGERARVVEPRGSKTLGPRDAILCRIYEHAGSHLLDGIHPARLGPRAADAIVERIRPRIDRRRRRLEVSQVRTPSVALALFREWQASAAADADGKQRRTVELRNTDGDVIEPATDTYAHSFTDAGALTRVLCSLPGVFEFESDDPHLCITRRRNATHPDWLRTTIAQLHVDAEHLRVECNSPRRADRVRAQLERLADAKLRHLHRKVAPVVSTVVDVDTGPLAVDAQPVSAWLGAPSSEWALADYLRRWQKLPQSSLDELTPQAAVEHAKLRREVHVQLREMEHRHGPKLAKAVARVRAELGLAADGSWVRVRKRDLELGMGSEASEVLLDFARPVLVAVEGPAKGRQVVLVAAEVWNYVGACGRPVTVEQLHDRCIRALGDAANDIDAEEIDLWIEVLVDRRLLFDDRRVFIVTDVRMVDGRFTVFVTGLPPGMARNLYSSERARVHAESEPSVLDPPAAIQPASTDGEPAQLQLFAGIGLDSEPSR